MSPSSPVPPSGSGPLPENLDPRNFALFASQELLDPQHAEVVKKLAQKFIESPELLDSLESVTNAVRGQLSEEELHATALATFGWSGEGGHPEDLPSPKQAAAAIGAAVAAIAPGPGVAVAAAA
jgi:hypothetical protein